MSTHIYILHLEFSYVSKITQQGYLTVIMNSSMFEFTVQPNLEVDNMTFPTQSGLNPITKHTSTGDHVPSQTLYSRLPSSPVQSTSAIVTGIFAPVNKHI